ncbi:MAG: hypothetical protein AAF389_18510 [Gemmatimonadota bacterium]
MSERASTLFRFWYSYTQEAVICGWASAEQFGSRLEALMQVSDPARVEATVALLSRETIAWSAGLERRARARLLAASVCRGGVWIEDVEQLLDGLEGEHHA